MVKIVFTGGGTGGHVFPIIAVLRVLRGTLYASNKEHEFFFIGPKDSFAPVLFFNERVPTRFILTGKMRRYFSFRNILDAFKVPVGVLQAMWHLWFLMPDAVFSKGGHGAFPVVVAAWLYRIPVVLHESDAIPGLANRILAKFSNVVISSFEDTPGLPVKKTILLGNPIRTELLSAPDFGENPPFVLDPSRKTILVIGGSQGAQRINDFILLILPKILAEFQVIHQCGEQNFAKVDNESRAMLKEDARARYNLVPFFQEDVLAFAYERADLIISRSGSGSIFEIAAAGKPSILIPLPESAQNHQRRNASRYGSYGAAIVLEEDNLMPNLFMEKVHEILDNPKVHESMGNAARAFAKPNAAYDIASEILKLIQ